MLSICSDKQLLNSGKVAELNESVSPFEEVRGFPLESLGVKKGDISSQWGMSPHNW